MVRAAQRQLEPGLAVGRVVALDVFESEIRDHRRGERQVVFDE